MKPRVYSRLLLFGMAWLVVVVSSTYAQDHPKLEALLEKATRILDNRGEAFYDDFNAKDEGIAITMTSDADRLLAALAELPVEDRALVRRLHLDDPKQTEAAARLLPQFSGLKKLNAIAWKDEWCVYWQNLELTKLQIYAGVSSRSQQAIYRQRTLESLDIPAIAFEKGKFESLKDLARLQGLNLSGSAITDGDLAMLSHMPELSSLDLSNTAITDDAIRYIEKCKKLFFLSIGETKVTDEGARELRRLFPKALINHYYTPRRPKPTPTAAEEKVEALMFRIDQIRDKGAVYYDNHETGYKGGIAITLQSQADRVLKTIAEWPAEDRANIRRIHLDDPQQTEASARMLPQLSGIKKLHIEGHWKSEWCSDWKDLGLTDLWMEDLRLSSACIDAIGRQKSLDTLRASGNAFEKGTFGPLKSLTRLSVLSLSGSRVTDDDLEFLSQMPNLVMLDLENTLITDRAIRHLAKCQKLFRLWIGNTALTEDGIRELERRLPKTVIQSDGEAKPASISRFLPRQLPGTRPIVAR